jgi:hypothetical protein
MNADHMLKINKYKLKKRNNNSYNQIFLITSSKKSMYEGMKKRNIKNNEMYVIQFHASSLSINIIIFYHT